ncbi:cyclin-dependent kinase-like 2 isoform X2 [Rhinatrema bivittatum]|uniref:cyclin-dependent kinase-like 2 isoform X2 n=1 Tax=Rhinatrema bivittatum TaxID=194408 RepID=UPI0011284388|nr:cyclin-dependent kinase-like 2 isoform X2 [Rhinatrema bivittatum]
MLVSVSIERGLFAAWSVDTRGVPVVELLAQRSSGFLLDMEKYENLGLVGEGSYGMVMKCRNKDSGRIVAVKKFLESEDDKMVKKIAMREIRLLKQLRHENLVNLLEVCKKKKRWYLVFEFVDHTVLDDLEQFPNGLDYNRVRKYLFQIVRGIGFCHNHNIIHRDIKPENILVSHSGVVKLCDFGFARTLAAPGEVYTDYVATRWYRAPELLVGDIKYGKAVDIWAIGCLITEMLTGEPLFPGDSDIDQLYHIMKCLGNLTPRHQELFYKNPLFVGVRLPEIREVEPLERRYPKLSVLVLHLAKKCLQIDPDKRPSCAELLQHDFFNKDGFSERFAQELGVKIQKDARDNPSFPKKFKVNKKVKEDSLGTEQKLLVVQDFNIDLKIKDTKVFKMKVLKVDSEKTDKNARSPNVNSLPDTGAAVTKIVPSAMLKESSTSLDYPRNPSIMIPPITPSRSAILSNVSASPVTGAGTARNSYRADEKTKKYINPFKKVELHSPAGHYNLNPATLVANEKNLAQTNKKRWEFSRSDVRLPGLNYSHLPELKGADVRNSKSIKKENRILSESWIPSLATVDIHNSSIALQQLSGNTLQDAPEANFPWVEH